MMGPSPPASDPFVDRCEANEYVDGPTRSQNALCRVTDRTRRFASLRHAAVTGSCVHSRSHQYKKDRAARCASSARSSPPPTPSYYDGGRR